MQRCASSHHRFLFPPSLSLFPCLPSSFPTPPLPPRRLSCQSLNAKTLIHTRTHLQAVEYFQRVINIQPDHGESWSAIGQFFRVFLPQVLISPIHIGHCYLMQDDLQKAYTAYQQALYWLPNPKDDPKLWYGIGILYDRYGSLDHAEEAFASVLRMDRGECPVIFACVAVYSFFLP